MQREKRTNNNLSLLAGGAQRSGNPAVYKENSLFDMDPRLPSAPGMTTQKAFTLIELLVVVLIIGILAAVALPQYEKAVMKSRIIQVVPVIRSLADAQKIYYYANGTYAESLDELGMSFPCPDGWTCVMGINVWDNNAKSNKIEAYRSDTETLGVNYYYGETREPELLQKLYCWAKTSDQKAIDICKSFGPELLTSGDYARYLIQ